MVVPVLVGVTLVIFMITRVLAPDPAPVVLGEHATFESMQTWRNEHGLNDPIYIQYFDFLRNALHGDLGTSYYSHQSVTREIAARFPATIELAVCAIVVASVVGVALGVIAAVYKNRLADHLSMLVALVGVSMPIFWSGILLIILFAGVLHILPSNGRMSPRILQQLMQSGAIKTGLYTVDALTSGNISAFNDAVAHLILPVSALSLYSMAIITRMTRSSILDALGEDYVRTARAKGLGDLAVNVKHALRNAMLPVSTVIGLQFGSLLCGAILTETVFSWPGIGRYAVDCVMKSDFPVIQGMVLLVAVIFVVINLVVDIIYAFLDPRIKYGSREEG
jgi:peptide/nickel transport system permease protein